MCEHCDYETMLKNVSLEPTPNRINVLRVIGDNSFPLSASDIYTTIDRHEPVNKVTIYRILDLLVEKQIVERISTGGRAAYYGMAPNEYHQAHPHFYCKSCGRMDCLGPDSISVRFDRFEQTFPGRIDKMEMRLDGICKNCLKQEA